MNLSKTIAGKYCKNKIQFCIIFILVDLPLITTSIFLVPIQLISDIYKKNYKK